jgi:sodium pump decarboxylase gamma subunit
MIIGMSVVFLFLIIMVVVLRCQGYVINRLFENGAVDTQENNNSADTTSDLTDAKKIAIISEAVKQHIQQNR